jgi:hypothetical protein
LQGGQRRACAVPTACRQHGPELVGHACALPPCDSDSSSNSCHCNERPHSRGMKCPSCASCMSLERKRAQGKPGARRTRSLVCVGGKHTSVVTTGTPQHHGIPCAMAPRLITRSPRCPGLIATVAREIVHELDPGVGRSGPHAFAARIAPLVGRANASIASRTTFRDDRDAPSSSGAERRNHTPDLRF